MSLLPLFVDVDDFCMAYQAYVASLQLEAEQKQRPGPKPNLSLSEVMTIIIHFQQSGYRHFKGYYLNKMLKHQVTNFWKVLLRSWKLC